MGNRINMVSQTEKVKGHCDCTTESDWRWSMHPHVVLSPSRIPTRELHERQSYYDLSYVQEAIVNVRPKVNLSSLWLYLRQSLRCYIMDYFKRYCRSPRTGKLISLLAMLLSRFGMARLCMFIKTAPISLWTIYYDFMVGICAVNHCIRLTKICFLPHFEMYSFCDRSDQCIHGSKREWLSITVWRYPVAEIQINNIGKDSDWVWKYDDCLGHLNHLDFNGRPQYHTWSRISMASRPIR